MLVEYLKNHILIINDFSCIMDKYAYKNIKNYILVIKDFNYFTDKSHKTILHYY